MATKKRTPLHRAADEVQNVLSMVNRTGASVYTSARAGAESGDPQTWATVVRFASITSTHADRLVVYAIAAARVNGASWADVGQMLGVTRQAAQQRYGKAVSAAVAEMRGPQSERLEGV
jgi:hypothetical protein